MIVEGPWLMTALLGGIPIVGVIGRLFGDDEETSEEASDEEVDDLLNESFDQQGFGDLEDDEDMFDEPDDRAMEELETRIDDMETELGNLSSTVSTVRSENEEIGDVIENIEDDVRKLLEIYEMVTRGINPFIDDDVGLGGEGSSSSVQLFENEDEETDGADIDEDLLEADAEEFFDEDAIDEDPQEAQEHEEDTMEPQGSSEDGKSFEELKEEYESEDADRVEDADTDDEPDRRSTIAPAGQPGMQKPYLTALPEHPVAELAVMEWLEYVVDTTDRCEARAAIRYYGDIGWIAPDLVEGLETYLDGFGPVDSETEDMPQGLGRAEHIATLQYLLAIDGASTGEFVGTTLDNLLTEGVLGDDHGPTDASRSRANHMSPDAGIAAEEGEGGASVIENVPEFAEETTLPDGGLALPLDERSSTGVDGDGS